MSDVLTLNYQLENLAQLLYNKWTDWDSARTNWKDEKKELRQYIHATDTRKTANAKLPWKN